MSTTQLDRSRSPTMPCILLVGERERANLLVHLAAIFHITGAAHTVIPIQRQHAQKLQHEEEETRLSRRQSRDRAKRAVQSSQATKIVAALKLPRPESVQTEIEERGVSIQKARRKRTHDIDNLAIIPVDSQQMPHIKPREM